MTTPPTIARTDRVITLALGLFVLAVTLATTALYFRSIDEIAVFSVARSLVGRGAVDGDVIFWTLPVLGRGSIIADGLDGHSYVVKDVAPSLLIAPLVWLAQQAQISPVRAGLLLSPLATAATASLLVHMLQSWGYRRVVAVLGGLTFALASLAWPYAETLFTQPLAAIGLLVALHGAIRAREGHGWQAALLGGLGLGLAGLSAVPTWITAPIYPLYLAPWRSLRQPGWRTVVVERARLIAAFAAGAGLFALIQAAYNFARFGDPLQTGYQQVGASGIRALHLGLGIFGQLFSTPRGVVWYAPFVILIPFGLIIGLRGPQRPRLILAAAQAAAIFLLYSAYATWWAGLCWGPRFLVAIMPACTLMVAPLLDRLTQPSPLWMRLLAGAVLLISTITQLLASLFDPLYTEKAISEALHWITPPPRFWVSDPVLTDLNHLPIPRQIAAAQAGQWDVLWAAQGRIDWLALACLVALVALTGGALVWALREPFRARWALVPLALGEVAMITLMLGRYPQGPNSAAGLDHLVGDLSARTQPDDAIIALLPINYLDWLDSYDSTVLDVGVILEDPLSARTAARLEQMAERHDRIWLVTEGTMGGNPQNGVEAWLAHNAFAGTEAWVEGYRMIPYTFEQAALADHGEPSSVAFGDGSVALESYAVQSVHRPSGAGWLNILLVWTAPAQPNTDYTVFVHLLNPSGILVAQHDGLPMSAFAPTRSWQPGSRIEDRRSLYLPDELPPGDYRLMVGLYNPMSGERLPLADSSADSLFLTTISLPGD